MDNDILWGYHPVFEALRAKRRTFIRLLVAQGKNSPRIEALIQHARTLGISVQNQTTQQLNSLVGHRRHQGICALVSRYPLCALDELLSMDLMPNTALFFLILDQINDPQNFGAIIRTAQCAGVHGMLVPKDRSAPPSAAVSKASAGALEHTQIAQVTNLVDGIKRLKSAGVWIVGADQRGAGTVFDADLTGPLAIVIGGEEKGMRPLVKKNCDFIISIPQLGSIGSLNASVAAAVIMYEVFRQRTVV